MLIELGPHLRNFFLVIEGKKMYFINFELHVCQTLSGLKIVANVQEEDSFYMLQIMIFYGTVKCSNGKRSHISNTDCLEALGPI